MEFHVSRSLRDRLGMDETLFRYTGDVVFGNVAASRTMATKLGELRAAAGAKDAVVNAGALFAMGLIDELNHAMVAKYRKDVDPGVLTEGLLYFEAAVGKAEVDRLLLAFCEEFPAVAVYRGEVTAAEWLKGSEDGLPNREAAFEELMMLWLENANPAFKPFGELFAVEMLKIGTAYEVVTANLPEYLATRPVMDPEMGTLYAALMGPMLAAPDSLTGQLDFIRDKWAPKLGVALKRVLLAVDTLREEEIAIWMRFNPAGPEKYRHGAPGFGGEGFVGDEYVGFEGEFGHWVTLPDGTRQFVKRYAADYQAPLNEYEAFSADQAWMPNVVMMAKSTYVWLEQLSRKYGRHIHRLDQIPDEELSLLRDRGMTALWLIGLWERSVASQTIKRLRGHADAVASAYSLKEYKIADDLGGNAGYESLRDRAGRYGIRLASDMVPNHMGIDSPWVIENPEWFVTRGESPFPSYTFEGPDLSNDSRVEIKIEDHYYDQTDAAVAFRIRNHRDGSTRFMYHGNDGTTFAWNDTAQLDYSKAAVREHVIQVILYVARLFPIIRFDAAMVLAKRHVQRLWYPLPGAGGSIPSRAEDAMSQEDFEAIMPHEFWREVVDRVAVEVPGTLLLAEAFWLLEGYFVRTLGMHRVYNSAFMNMLRDEENAKYRSYLKKTVEFDPDILKRYVNFMSNPDERTAIDQFGSGDKFFGCCTLLATLPGLPMFGHGQVEGFGERYGMDFKKARMEEVPNEGLVSRHQNEIAPLLKRRHMFAESENFLLYDFWTEHGSVDENVFAYSNRNGRDRSIVVYNNSFGSTGGTLHRSAASVEKASGEMKERSLMEGLALPDAPGMVMAYRDTASGLEYLRRVSDVRDRGLTLPLRGYQYAVLLDWRELQSTSEKPWDVLADALRGGGVYSVEEALREMRLRPLQEALRGVLATGTVKAFCDVAEGVESAGPDALLDARLGDFVGKSLVFFDRAAELGVAGEREAYGARVAEMAQAAAGLVRVAREFSTAWPVEVRDALPGSTDGPRAEVVWGPLLGWIAFAGFGSADVFEALGVRAALAEVFAGLGLEGDLAWQAAARVRALLASGGGLGDAEFWQAGDVRWLAGYRDGYVNKERFEELVCLLQAPGLVAGRALKDVERGVVAACAGMAAAGYVLEMWVASLPGPVLAGEAAEPAAEPGSGASGTAATGKGVAAKRAGARTGVVQLAAKPQGALGGKLKKEQHKGAHDVLVKKEHTAEMLQTRVAPIKGGAKAAAFVETAGAAGAKVSVAAQADAGKSAIPTKTSAGKSAAVVAKEDTAEGVAAKQVAVKLAAKPKGALGGKLKKEQHTGSHDVLVKKEGARDGTKKASKVKDGKS